MIRLRQIALVAHDLESAAADIERELGIERCFSDPGVGVFGLHNVLFPIGDTFLEIVSPTQDGTTAGRLLERRHGDGGYMVILQTGDLPAARSRAVAAGVRIVFEAEGDAITGLHFHPRDVGGAILSIDQPEEAPEWSWAGPVWRDHVRTDIVSEIVGVTVQANDPAAMARRWSEVIGAGVAHDGLGVQLDRGEIRFTAIDDDRGEGVAAISCTTSDPERTDTMIEVGGITVHFVAGAA